MPLFHQESWSRWGTGEGRDGEKGDMQIRLIFSSMADIYSVVKVQHLESTTESGPVLLKEFIARRSYRSLCWCARGLGETMQSTEPSL